MRQAPRDEKEKEEHLLRWEVVSFRFPALVLPPGLRLLGFWGAGCEEEGDYGTEEGEKADVDGCGDFGEGALLHLARQGSAEAALPGGCEESLPCLEVPFHLRLGPAQREQQFLEERLSATHAHGICDRWAIQRTFGGGGGVGRAGEEHQAAPHCGIRSERSEPGIPRLATPWCICTSGCP